MLVFLIISLLSIASWLKPVRSEEKLPSGGVQSHKPPNVIFILADDLGYGDTSVHPFTSPQFQTLALTPELERMAKKGRIMTNFHVASPVCSPSRVSIMTALFPWRLGVDFIYAQDLKNDSSEELEHEQMPLIPNMAMSFRDNGYYTAHVGKWHLGGLSPDDIASRRRDYQHEQALSEMQSGTNNVSHTAHACATPGPLQYGYDEFVCMSEGNRNSDRYVTQRKGVTYKQGARYLLRNDVAMQRPKADQWLTDAQTDEAMRVIRERSGKSSDPFFLNLWYDAPHSPWEAVEPFFSDISRRTSGQLPPRLHKYMSMIANMDWNIGRLLRLVDDLGIAENTIVVFTSDNGPENQTGSGGPFQGIKRLLMEGGIRVPAIWQWKGRIAEDTRTDVFGLSTDIFPTLMHAAGLAIPPHVRIDGQTMLPALLGVDGTLAKTRANPTTQSPAAKGDDRTMLWYTHCPGFPKLSAAWSHGFKLIWNDYEGRQSNTLPPNFRLFDMRIDPYEKNNLLPKIVKKCDQVPGAKQGKTVSFDWEAVSTIRGCRECQIDPNYLDKGNNSDLLLKLAKHMQLKMHLFRFLGQEDWLRYHENKPFTVEKYCTRRRSRVDTLHWMNMLPPEYCGNGIASDPGSANCRCSFSECSPPWLRTDESLAFMLASAPKVKESTQEKSSWISGPLFDAFDVLSGEESSQRERISNILNWSNFQSLCSIENAFVAGKGKGVGKGKGGSQSTRVSSAKKLAIFPEMYASKSYQRVFRRDEHTYAAYVSGSACVSDEPIAWQNAHGMHAPVPLCPASANALLAAGSDTSPMFDDGAFVFALNDALHTNSRSGTSRPFRNDFYGAFDSDHITLGKNSYTYDPKLRSPPETIVDVAIVDPVFAYNVLQSKGNPALSDSGFFSHVLHRLHSGSSAVMLVCPVLLNRGWASFFLLVPASPGMDNSTLSSPIAIWANPITGYDSISEPQPQSARSQTSGMYGSGASTSAAQKIQKALMQMMHKARAYDVDRRFGEGTLLPIVEFHSRKTSATSNPASGSGMRVLMFANSLRQAFLRNLPITEVLASGAALQQILDYPSDLVDQLTRECAQRYVERGRAQAKSLEVMIRNATFPYHKNA